MGERAVDFSFDTFIFIILIAIVLIIVGIIYANAIKVEEKSRFAGASGVVRADSADVTFNSESEFELIMINVEHEEGKQLKVVPVLNPNINDKSYVSISDRVYRLGSKNNPSAYLSYQLPGDIEGVFITNPMTPLPESMHVSLWEVACLDKIGFKDNLFVVNFQFLVKECSSAYLASFYITLKASDNCMGKRQSLCDIEKECYFSITNECKSCSDVSKNCADVRDEGACQKCNPGKCFYDSSGCHAIQSSCSDRKTLLECIQDDKCNWNVDTCIDKISGGGGVLP